ncbi:CAP domain-containing protein [Oscillatoria sp. FACHB-1407]|uniref:CAP domain-containing protein n=1 Tax=Oscillatoria sp. FACHB-1407 TaxID=2692847 RepID=UPI001F551EEC|nr:CAP domain-containing protein [Oscillatoria sp. FACHB-1407]
MRDRVGNTSRQASTLRLGTTVSEAIGGQDQNDFYRFVLTGANQLTVNLKRASNPVAIELAQDRNGNGQIERTEILRRSRSSGATASLHLPNLEAGTFFLRVSTRSTGETGYRLSAIAQPLMGSTASQTTDTLNSTSPTFVERVVSLTNAFRQQFGLQPLTLNSKLNTAAQTHSQNMAVQDFFSHTGADGSQPWDRMTRAGYRWSRAAENIAAGQQTPEAVVDAWMNSPGHRANILNANFREIGVGYYELTNDTGNVNYGRYWTQNFGTAV